MSIDFVRLSFLVGVAGTLDNVHDNGHTPVIRPRGNFRTAYLKPKRIVFVMILFNNRKNFICF